MRHNLNGTHVGLINKGLSSHLFGQRPLFARQSLKSKIEISLGVRNQPKMTKVQSKPLIPSRTNLPSMICMHKSIYIGIHHKNKILKELFNK